MGIIVNPRGAAGSGKTELVRRLMEDYGWRRGLPREGNGCHAIPRKTREQPIGYLLDQPFGGRPLMVIGHYERTSGGCDTVALRDGGLEEVFRLADAYASDGCDVLMEGLALSAETARSAALARRHPMHILKLTTPAERAARNLVARRRGRREAWEALAEDAAIQCRSVTKACEMLAGQADVQFVGFDAALARCRLLLGTGDLPAAPSREEGLGREGLAAGFAAAAG